MNKSPLIPCGRGLAPDSGMPVDIIIGCEAAIGGKPHPTLSWLVSGEHHG